MVPRTLQPAPRQSERLHRARSPAYSCSSRDKRLLLIAPRLVLHNRSGLKFYRNQYIRLFSCKGLKSCSAWLPAPRRHFPSIRILRRSDRCKVWKRAIEAGAAIKDQVSGCRIEGKRLAQLLNNPRAGRMPRHVEVQNSSPVMRNDEEAVENSKSERRHGEEIHGGDGFSVIAQKRCPSLCRLRIPWRLPHPSQHSSLRNVEAQIRALCHRGQKRRNITQRNRSALGNRGRGRCRARTKTCCRKARFSKRR